jgi:hypothetical protein
VKDKGGAGGVWWAKARDVATMVAINHAVSTTRACRSLNDFNDFVTLSNVDTVKTQEVSLVFLNPLKPLNDEI